MTLINHKPDPQGSSSRSMRFSSTWDLIGPFQIGTREASWGADPLECLGGFRSLQRDSNSSYASSLASFGQVHWTDCNAESIHETEQAVEIALNIDFPDIDWHWLQQINGWAALQYQAWARGELIIGGSESRSVVFYTDGLLEFWIDDKHYFGGDFYAFRRVPVVLHLKPGSHQTDLRIIRDVRGMGGLTSSMSINLRAERSGDSLVVLEEKLLISDVVNGVLASPYAALPVRNDGMYSILIQKVEAASSNCDVKMKYSSSMKLLPGQSRSIPLHINLSDVSEPNISFKVVYIIANQSTLLTNVLHHVLNIRDLYSPHKMTFLHPSQIVSYAILRPPSKTAIETVGPGQSLPVHLNLHGAGLDCDSDQVRHMLDEVPDLRAFVLFPTGVTPWSGDDWHDWGFADVIAAVASIGDWTSHVGWKGPQVDLDKWLVTGHSNGGQGTLYAMTHCPDRIIGAAPVSGYLSIQKYVPYDNWHEAESRMTHVIQSALQSFRHELLVENFAGIPVLHQHVSKDDNVPVTHSRRLHQLTSEFDQKDICRYHEVPGEGHWYEGIMTTALLQDFYNHCLAGKAKRPALPPRFQIVVSDTANMASRGGLQVDQLSVPDQLGRIEVAWDADSGTVRCDTSNIRRFHFNNDSVLIKGLAQLFIDGKTDPELQTAVNNQHTNGAVVSLVLIDGLWTVSKDSKWLETERHGRQVGPLHSILRTHGYFSIQCLVPGATDIALQISRNLYQYLEADSDIVERELEASAQLGNVITVSLGTDRLPNNVTGHPVEIDKEGVVLHRRDGSSRRYCIQDGLGVIFLQPLANEGLRLTIWGSDEMGLRQTARLFPMQTGVGQPDFIVVGKSMGWKGAAGALAMGSFDSRWQISEASYLQ